MGEEAPEHLLNGLDEISHAGLDSGSCGYQTATTVGHKIFVIGRSDDGADMSISVKLFDKLTGKWSFPTALGTKPNVSKGHSAVILNKDRILILKKGAPSEECIWFLEVDTLFVREQQQKGFGTEVVAWSKGIQVDGLKPIVISGPSGVGKGTLISKLMKDFPSTFGFSVSHTTRAPRNGEKDGVHYHFTERSIMETDIKEGKFLESASVHGNLYGTSIEAVEAVTDAGKRCILDIDVQGARSVRASSIEAIFIFICPPSFEELEKRLRARGTETEEQVQKRLKNARAELEHGKTSGIFDHILVNDDLDTCYDNLKKILSLDESCEALYEPSMKNFNVTQCHSISVKEGKVLIQSGNPELEGAQISFLLDVSSLKGGAPGRTRGITISEVEPSRDGRNGCKQT